MTTEEEKKDLTFAGVVGGLYIAIGFGVGLTWPIWVWFLAN